MTDRTPTTPGSAAAHADLLKELFLQEIIDQATAIWEEIGDFLDDWGGDDA